MSYNLNIWSRQRIETDQKELKIGEYTVTVEESVLVEAEDIPTNVMLSLAEIKYLTSVYLQPYTDEKAVTDKVIRYAKKLAKETYGVVENPQLGNEVYPTNKGKTFSRATKEDNIISICWYMDCKESLSHKLPSFIDLLENDLPPALPRRYGSYEPPQFKYSETGKDHLIRFLNDEQHPVLYCTKPIIYLFLSDAYTENQKYGVTKNYRCNKIEITMLKEAYSEPNWQFSVKKLFKKAAELLKPFYAEIIDEKEQGVCAWWWKGIPAKRGNPVIFGEPYSSLLGTLPDENKIENELYYFEDDISIVKIPRKLISSPKLLARKTKNAILSARDLNYAKHFPFQ